MDADTMSSTGDCVQTGKKEKENKRQRGASWWKDHY
jgi:hypothetical protein